MTGAPAGLRPDAHQAALAAAIHAVLSRLDGSTTSPPPDSAAGPSALATVCACFGLTAFERDVLVLAAAADLDPTTAGRCAAASGDACRPYPTFSLALAALGEPHWSAITPVAPLRRWRLVELDDETSLTTSRLRADERILHFLAGVPYLDPRLRGLARPVEAPADLPSAYLPVTAALAGRWSWPPTGGQPHAEITGADPQTRRDITAAAAREAGLRAYVLRDTDLPAEAADLEELARLWEREAILLPAVLLIEAGSAERLRGVEGLLSSVAVPAAVSGDDPLPVRSLCGTRLTVPALDRGEQLRLWTSALGGVTKDGAGRPEIADTTHAGLRQLVAQFSLPAHVIRAAGASVRHLVTSRAQTTADLGQLAWQAGLAEARVALDELGRRVEPRASWDDLVLPGPQRVILDEIAAHVRQRATVYEDWGFDARAAPRARRDRAVRRRVSGTGKTLAAEVVARELGLDLFVIDLSPGREQVHRRDGEEPAQGVRRGRARRRGAAVRRGRRALRQAQRGEGQPRPVRQHRGQLPAAAHGGLPRPGHPDHQHEEGARPGVHAPAALRGRVPVPRPRGARGDLAARHPRPGADATISTSTASHSSTWRAAASATSRCPPRSWPPTRACRCGCGICWPRRAPSTSSWSAGSRPGRSPDGTEAGARIAAGRRRALAGRGRDRRAGARRIRAGRPRWRRRRVLCRAEPAAAARYRPAARPGRSGWRCGRG